jgi:hypothetical protein
MSEHISLERTYDLIDGLLSSEATERARAHMATCAECRERYATISELTTDLGSLPVDAVAPDGIWEGISRRIDGTMPGSAPDVADVIELPSARGARQRLSFTLTQLLAASLVLSFLSAGTIWIAMSNPTTEPTPQAEVGSVSATRFVADEGSYDVAIDELMTIVQTARPFLAPETLLALDESIATIDTAIAEIVSALDSDPSSELLHSMLVNQQRSKVRVLSQVARLAEARS